MRRGQMAQLVQFEIMEIAFEPNELDGIWGVLAFFLIGHLDFDFSFLESEQRRPVVHIGAYRVSREGAFHEPYSRLFRNSLQQKWYSLDNPRGIRLEKCVQ